MVDYWTVPGHHGTELAIFLQFHDADGQELEAGQARVRFAYRNFMPESIDFKRQLRSSGVEIGPYHADETLNIWPAREGGPRYVERIIEDVVAVRRAADHSEIKAAVRFVRPDSYSRLNLDELRIAFPGGDRARCTCCSQSFPI